MNAPDPFTEVENPVSGAVIARVADTSVAEVGRVVARARAAQPGWAAIGTTGRSAWLKRARGVLLAHTDQVIAGIVAETGKTYEDALLTEFAHVARACGYWARRGPGFLADERQSRRGPSRRTLIVRHHPRGVVGVIGPSNFPLIGSFGEALAALMAGNTVVLKPSPLTPLTSRLMVDLLREAGLGAGVLQVATGGRETAEALIDAADYVAFTGSTAAGRAVAEAGGPT